MAFMGNSGVERQKKKEVVASVAHEADRIYFFVVHECNSDYCTKANHDVPSFVQKSRSDSGQD